MFTYYKRKIFLFAFLKDPVGATFKRRFRLSATTDQKIGSGSGAALKLAAPGGSGFATLFTIFPYKGVTI